MQAEMDEMIGSKITGSTHKKDLVIEAEEILHG